MAKEQSNPQTPQPKPETERPPLRDTTTYTERSDDQRNNVRKRN